MRVLYFISSLGPGGAERSLVEMAPHLVGLGIHLDVAVLYDKPGFERDLAAAGVERFSLAGERGRLGWLRAGRRLVRQLEPDLVHTTLFDADVTARVAARLEHTPVVSSLVNTLYGEQQRLQPGVPPWKLFGVRALDAATAQVVNRFHAVSSKLADLMAPRLRVRRDRIDVVPRGRDPQRLGARTAERRERARAGLGLREDGRLLLAVARHEYQKGLDVLLRALPGVVAAAPTTRLAVAGREGRQTAALRRLADELQLTDRVAWLGARHDVPELLCAADVFVMPSRWEGLPGALIEAMALEAPVVASDLGEIREVVPDERFARLVAPESPAHLAAGITTALGDEPGSRQRARAARRHFVQHFSIGQVAQRMKGLYDKVLAS